LDCLKETCFVNEEKLTLIYNGLADVYKKWTKSKKEKLKEKYLIDANDKIILFAGRLDEIKGISFLINAFQKLIKTHRNTRLIIAGDGNYSRWLSETNGYWSKISFTGQLSKKQLYKLYNIADLGIVSSIHEEFGFVAIEMMMHELPVIVADTGGLSEIIDNNQNGLKVPVNVVKGKRIINTNILCEKMCFVIDNPEKATYLGKNARKKFLEKYELNSWGEKMLSFYNNVLNS
jgi:glycosyltransferase involved in cell wall biosynthesis